MFKIAYSKPNKWFVAKSVKEQKNYEYVKYIFRKIIKWVNAGKRSSRKNTPKRQLSLLVAPRERPSKGEKVDRSHKNKRIKLQILLIVALADFTCSKLTHFKFVLALLVYF